ncbi:twin-arginine translocation pathway signal, partial [Synechococcus sp. GFB01]|uniref:twin-arginine translocation pathway signal n=1 Tax=Synechococcus sp. GFB01 TaxID=1662190 RepID=UPI000AF8B9FE
RASRGPRLLAVKRELAPAWAGELPAPWGLETAPDPEAVLKALRPAAKRAGLPDLVALADGWATSAERDRWLPLDQSALLAELAGFAAAPARLFGPEGQPPLAFPWAYTPWVIALRSRPDLARQQHRGWDLLLDASLRGRLVLPSSPRVCITLMGADFERVRQLRRQVLAHDDRDGLNLLLAGQAEAAVLPLRPLVPLLRRDPRLQVIWPASGAPLSWQLLLRPAGARHPAPERGSAGAAAAAAGGPAGGRLGAPPAAAAAEASAVPLPAACGGVAAPTGPAGRCWSLPPLDPRRRLALQSLWDAAA